MQNWLLDQKIAYNLKADVIKILNLLVTEPTNYQQTSPSSNHDQHISSAQFLLSTQIQIQSQAKHSRFVWWHDSLSFIQFLLNLIII